MAKQYSKPKVVSDRNSNAIHVLTPRSGASVSILTGTKSILLDGGIYRVYAVAGTRVAIADRKSVV